MRIEDDINTLATETVALSKRTAANSNASGKSSVPKQTPFPKKKIEEPTKVDPSGSGRQNGSEKHVFCILCNAVLLIVVTAFIVHVVALKTDTYVKERMLFKFIKRNDWCGHLITKAPSAPADDVYVMYADMKPLMDLDAKRFKKHIRIWFAFNPLSQDMTRNVISVVPVVNDLLYAAGVSLYDNSVFILPLPDVEPKT